MRATFVIRLAPSTEPAQSRFEGLVEEVDSGKQLRFRSTEELLRFLGQRFLVAFGPSKGTSKREKDPFSQREEPPA